MSWIRYGCPLRRVWRWLSRMPRPGRARSWVRQRIAVGLVGALVVAVLGWLIGCGPLDASGTAAPGTRSSSRASVPGPVASGVPTVSGMPGAVGWSDPGAAFAFLIPADVSVVVGPALSVSGENVSSLTGQFPDVVSAFVEAWAAGDVRDPRLAAWCLLGCAATLSGVIDVWASAGVRPTGTLRVVDERAQTARAGTFGVVSVCLDVSGLHAVNQSLATVSAPSPGGATLILFALEDDTVSGHWVATEAYSAADSAVCTGGAS